MKLPKINLSGTGQGADNTSSFINSFFPSYMVSKDRIQARKDKERSRQKLSEIFGGQPLPAVLQGMEDLPLDQAMDLIPAMGNMAYKQEMADINRGKLAAVEQAATVEQSQAERGLTLTEKRNAQLAKNEGLRLAEETRQNKAAENQKRNKLDLDRLKKKSADLEKFIATAHDLSQPFSVRDTAETNAINLATELNEYYPVDGEWTDWYKAKLRKVVGKSSKFVQPSPSNVQPAPAAQPMRSANPAGPVNQPHKAQVKTAPDGTRYIIDANGNPVIVE